MASLQEYKKAHRRAHRSMYRKANSEWKKRNRQKVNAQRRRYYQKYREEEKEKSRLYAINNPEIYRAASAKRRTKITKAGGSFTPAEFKALCNKYGNKCLCCGKKTKLEADHVIPVELGGSSNIENIQPLCKPCNSKKHTRSTDFRKVHTCLLLL